MHRDISRGENAHELKRSVFSPTAYFADTVGTASFRGNAPTARWIIIYFCVSRCQVAVREASEGTTVWQEREKGRREKGREREGERERAGESRMEEDASPRARSSNYYGFSGSNSPDGNTTQFTHADCAREDVNSCQSDGPFHLLFFAGAPNRHRGRRAGRLFGFPLSPRLFFALPPFPLFPPLFYTRFTHSCLRPILRIF